MISQSSNRLHAAVGAHFICEALEHSQKLGKVNLTVRKLATTRIIRAIERCCTINDEKRISVDKSDRLVVAGKGKHLKYRPTLLHHRGGLDQQLALVVRVVSSCVGNVVENLFSIQVVPLRNRKETLGPEGAFRVDVQALSLATAHRARKLGERSIRHCLQ